MSLECVRVLGAIAAIRLALDSDLVGNALTAQVGKPLMVIYEKSYSGPNGSNIRGSLSGLRRCVRKMMSKPAGDLKETKTQALEFLRKIESLVKGSGIPPAAGK